MGRPWPLLLCLLVTATATAQERPPSFDGAPTPQLSATVSRDDKARVTVRAVRLTAPLRIDGDLDEELYRTATPMSDFIKFVSGLVQYSSSNSSMGTNVRMRWEYQPGSELFVVYNDARDTRRPGLPGLQTRALVVKITRLFRV